MKIARAGAGFDTDPMGAAARIAATGAQGAQADSQGMVQNYESSKLRQATVDNTAAYRESVMADRNARTAEIQHRDQQVSDLKNRSLAQGMVAAAAATGNQTIYDQARQRASQLYGKSISDFDIDKEFPPKVGDYISGTGLNAQQYARDAISQASIKQRATAADNAHADRQAANGTSRANARDRIDANIQSQIPTIAYKINNDIPLEPAESAIWTHYMSPPRGAAIHVPPPSKKPAPPAGGGSGSQPYTAYANGPNGRLGFDPKQNKWVPVK